MSLQGLRPVVTASGDAGQQRSRGQPKSSRSSRMSPGGQRGRLSAERAAGMTGAFAERPICTTPAALAQPAVAEEECLETASTQQRTISVLNRYRALLLDASYRPVGVANWQRAICLDLMDKADVLEYYEQSVRSVQLEYYLPAVLRVRRHRNAPRRAATVTLNRANVMLRDRYQCQYCGSSRDLTIDHVVAQSKGGGNTWTNLVACCSSCNSKKGDKSLEQLRWKLRQQPKEPSTHEMQFVVSMLVGSTSQDALPLEWQAYIVPFTRAKKSKQQQAS